MAKKLPLLTALFIAFVFTSSSAYSNVLNVNSSMPIAGNKNGQYQIVEFFDYRCAYCRKMVPILEKIAKHHPKTQIVMIEYPIFGGGSEMLAKAALAVHKTHPEKYFDFHKLLMQHKGEINDNVISKYAKKLGMNGKALVNESKKAQYDKFLDDNRTLAKEYGVKGTPHVVIDGYSFSGLITYEDYKKYYKEIQK